MADDFPADLKQFIERNIDSLAQLELLLLLHSDKERVWNVAEISKAMSFSSVMASQLLRDLTQRGFATPTDECFRYGVIDSNTDQLIGRLGETYRSRRVAVTTEIYSKPVNRLKSFSDAFRLRKDP